MAFQMYGMVLEMYGMVLYESVFDEGVIGMRPWTLFPAEGPVSALHSGVDFSDLVHLLLSTMKIKLLRVSKRFHIYLIPVSESVFHDLTLYYAETHGLLFG